jgi:UDP:flavonoid glycosyltransferase YjiC (YdhE family)
MKTVIYYSSGHGMGHAIRTTVMVEALQQRWPDLDVVIRTNAPERVFSANLNGNYRFMPLEPDERLDLGLIQIDSLRIDFDASLNDISDLLDNADGVICREAEFIKNIRPKLVVCDIPFLSVAAAKQAHIPAVVAANFSWDWIYRAYENLDLKWGRAADKIKSYYASADLLIQFPMAPDMSDTFPNIIKLGLTGRKANRPADTVRSELGIPLDRPMVLLTFADLNLPPNALNRMADENPGTAFVYSAPLGLDHPDFYFADDRRIWYPNLVGAAHLVITKPGYGIVSDCLTNNTPMVYTDRGRFAEYPLLVEAVESYLHHRYINSRELYAGRLGTCLTGLAPPRSGAGWPYSFKGAMEGADALARFITD